ncbi:hypothetical protein ACKAWT_18440 [Xanthomonas vasicola]|nr:hypothetical protein [Xanthomonas vasicola]MDO6949784.1 hypothetical protein [Xanthomonas vasicola]MDO6954772.1 hypothetical protein [Xanthomonas vasicola]MDO6961223.1 hypothetical protein [Xanthomonas vasicola]MDO6969640.1 hypothetical protein [Xanthomonas vasicola]MDO6971468.1 hypothetical protein [Xanthomonas vasicola]
MIVVGLRLPSAPQPDAVERVLFPVRALLPQAAAGELPRQRD